MFKHAFTHVVAAQYSELFIDVSDDEDEGDDAAVHFLNSLDLPM